MNTLYVFDRKPRLGHAYTISDLDKHPHMVKRINFKTTGQWKQHIESLAKQFPKPEKIYLIDVCGRQARTITQSTLEDSIWAVKNS